MTGEILLHARGLVAGYHKRPVVGPVELAITDNDTLALVGPNGVGKSTLLQTLAGLVPPIAGALTYQGRSVPNAPTHRHARHGLVFVGEHRANVLRSLTVEENLRLATGKRRASTVDPSEPFPRLGERRHQLAGTLSGGELQMLSLSMALARTPRCLLLDEPSAGLAPIVLDELQQAFHRLTAAGLCLIIAEQRPEIVRGLCTRIAIIAEGQLSYLDPSGDALTTTYFGLGTNDQNHSTGSARDA